MERTIWVEVEKDINNRPHVCCGEVTIQIDEHKGTRDTPGAVKMKAVHYALQVTGFDEDGGETIEPVTDEWRQLSYEQAIEKL
jgi:hypothetical protein